MYGELLEYLQSLLAQQWVIRSMRVGYTAKGILYFLIGLLAGRAALLPYAEAGGSYSALLSLADKPFGTVLLAVFAISLLGYVLRRFLQAAIDPGHPHLTLQRVVQRSGYMMSGCSYLGVSYSALIIVFGLRKSGDELEILANQLLEQPFGNWLVGFVGLATVGVGLSYIYGAVTGAYLGDLQSIYLHRQFETWVIWAGKLGFAARGIAFTLIGAFFVEAALRLRAESAGGLENALQRLANQPYGPLWLGAIGAGLIAYAIYMLVAAWYRRSVLI